MNNIKICKYYKHPKTCTADKINCFCRLHKDMCSNNLYYSMALEQKADKYKQALDEIEKYLDAQQKYFDSEDYHNLLDIINKAKQ